ncbi:hypothetical protein RJ639_042357 [Escallonia herrerae]|uniref:Uncharacterized protein n=1 Tax=Escallonia herrerae TaxID=1293975 RepID=A0AA88WGW0_9ASTE|nr:hypothetical protein RJ639_042357 [Escallonia herrerae]
MCSHTNSPTTTKSLNILSLFSPSDESQAISSSPESVKVNRFTASVNHMPNPPTKHSIKFDNQPQKRHQLLQPPTMTTTAAADDGSHLLIFPYPAQGHMIPLLDLAHHLATRGLTITVLVTPRNVPLLKPLLSKHPSITPLVLPFPAHPTLPAGVENVKDLPPNGFRPMMSVLGELQEPIFHWFHSHPSPPVAIISDMFLGWTQHLAGRLGIRRFVFSPSGAMALAVIYSLWRDMPKRDDPNDENHLVSFPDIPSSPVYPWWQLSPIYRSYLEGDPVSEFIKDGFRADMASWGLVINSFDELERVYLEYLMGQLGNDRVWAVGPLLPPDDEDRSKPSERGGSISVLASQIFSWLDKCGDQTVVYVCFGSQAVLTNHQMEELASGLEKSGAS